MLHGAIVIKTDWFIRFLKLAEHISTWSKDPSTKVGSVIVDKDKRIVSLGYNGFPRGVKDDKERYNNRDLKYPMVCHSERNAILFARRDLRECELFTTAVPCATCAGIIIQAGITKVVTYETPKGFAERWSKDISITHTMFGEAGVSLIYVPRI